MTEPEFWKLISEARAACRTIDEVPAWLESRLHHSTLAEITDFNAWLATFLGQADDYRLQCAGAIIIGVFGAIGDDGFVDFRCWLIAHGEEIYKSAMANPDSLADYFDVLDGVTEQFPHPFLETFKYVSRKPFEALSGGREPGEYKKLIPGWTPPPGTVLSYEGTSHLDFWDGQDKERLVTLFPKLTKRFPSALKS